MQHIVCFSKRHRLLQRLSDADRTKAISLNPFQIYVRHVLSKFMTSMLAYSQEVYSIGKTIPYVGSRYMKVQYIPHD